MKSPEKSKFITSTPTGSTTPKKTYPRAYYFNQLTGEVANLISEVKVLMEEQTVQVDRTGFIPHVNTLNKLFCQLINEKKY